MQEFRDLTQERHAKDSQDNGEGVLGALSPCPQAEDLPGLEFTLRQPVREAQLGTGTGMLREDQ